MLCVCGVWSGSWKYSWIYKTPLFPVGSPLWSQWRHISVLQCCWLAAVALQQKHSLSSSIWLASEMNADFL